MSDNEIVAKKVAFIKEQVSEIESLLRRKSRKEVLSDPWLIKGLKYSLQIAIEAMIDIIYHICAKHFKKAPTDARDGLYILLENKLITEKDFLTFSQMIGFRNKVVHCYQQVSSEKVYEIAANELSDFDRFVELVLDFMRKLL
jgi:uncharacterized protein YutE (UPF0331/DUF86 family)